MRIERDNADKTDEAVTQGKLDALFLEARQLLRDMKMFLREQRLESVQDHQRATPRH